MAGNQLIPLELSFYYNHTYFKSNFFYINNFLTIIS